VTRRPHFFALSLCVGLATADVARVGLVLGLALAVVAAGSATVYVAPRRRLLIAVAVALAGWAWGSARLDTLDRSVLAERVGTAERARVIVTGPPRAGRFDVRAPGTVVAWGGAAVDEAVLLKLPHGRSPPQGAVVEVIGTLTAPREFERTRLRRHGVHVVLRASQLRVVGRRGGLGGVADRLRAHLGRSVAVGLHGERKALLEGVVLGDDSALSEELRDRFRASGLYHLLAVSGQNVALVAGGALLLAWIAGVPRLLGEVGALIAIAGYVLAVGAQPSVVRAGIAGVLGSLAWLVARARDRWYFLLLGAIALLGWNPYTLLDPGFELSFAAVVSIFVLAPRIRRWLDGYPMPERLREVVAISAACGLATAPIAWIHFHALALLTIPANALAAPAVVPLLGLALAAAAVAPLSTGAAGVLAWLNGWCAAYLAGCARLIGGIPGAQIQSTRALLVLLAGVLLLAAYAWPRVTIPLSRDLRPGDERRPGEAGA
jgi:competence protein ComEC